MVVDSSLLETQVFHKRHAPTVYGFSHKVIFLALNLKHSLSLRLLSIEKFNLLSVLIKKPDVDIPGAKHLVFVTMPKILGYAFNPVSFWLYFNQKQELMAVVADVNNTFGENHRYICAHPSFAPIGKTDWIEKSKIFHVSPFCQVQGCYQFRFDIDVEKMNIDINYSQDDDLTISTAIRGKRKALTDSSLTKSFIMNPFMILKVMILIHYHALRLWIKKVPYFKKPNKPNIDIS